MHTSTINSWQLILVTPAYILNEHFKFYCTKFKGSLPLRVVGDENLFLFCFFVSLVDDPI